MWTAYKGLSNLRSRNMSANANPRVIKKTRILGVDPGSRILGYGVVDVIGSEIKLVDHGVLKLASTSGKSVIPLEQRLLDIYKGLTKIIEEHRPDILSIEKVFFAKNAVSALKLGQARGAAILTAMISGLKIVEYSPTEVKSMIVGYGQADKEQVSKMLEILFGKQKFQSNDASDGLALAVCHAKIFGSQSNLSFLTQNTLTTKKTKKKMSLAEAVGIKK